MIECQGLDTPEQVFFYEQDFYILSNFSAFQTRFMGVDHMTSEHAYQWAKFCPRGNYRGSMEMMERIRLARSAHDAFKQATEIKYARDPDWDTIKLEVMYAVLVAKVSQHEYVRRKLLSTGDRELVENSWRDDFWGWGPNKNGRNELGKLWMRVRKVVRDETLRVHE